MYSITKYLGFGITNYSTGSEGIYDLWVLGPLLMGEDSWTSFACCDGNMFAVASFLTAYLLSLKPSTLHLNLKTPHSHP